MFPRSAPELPRTRSPAESAPAHGPRPRRSTRPIAEQAREGHDPDEEREAPAGAGRGAGSSPAVLLDKKYALAPAPAPSPGGQALADDVAHLAAPSRKVRVRHREALADHAPEFGSRPRRGRSARRLVSPRAGARCRRSTTLSAAARRAGRGDTDAAARRHGSVRRASTRPLGTRRSPRRRASSARGPDAVDEEGLGHAVARRSRPRSCRRGSGAFGKREAERRAMNFRAASSLS